MFLQHDVRPGDNLYSDSLLALDADTGKLRWYFQHIPHDLWDFDSQAEPVLVDTTIDGKPVQAIVQAHKNGYLYAFARATGQLLYAKPYVPRITWTTGLDAKGRPTPHIVPSPEGAVFCPSLLGAKNWNHTAYNPSTGYLYVATSDLCAKVTTLPVGPQPGVPYLGGEFAFVPEGAYGMVQAIEVKTGESKWQFRTKYPLVSSVLATGGGLVFTGDPSGMFFALDARTSEFLWQFNTGSGHRASAISYAVGGKQYIAVPAGWAGPAAVFLPGAFPEAADFPQASTLIVFGLFEE
jgi:alcohol dehydrogenase (cytochrome c)